MVGSHLQVLEQLTTELRTDDNVVALLVFGSVAKGTFHERSDIDLTIVYNTHSQGFEFSPGIVGGIKVGFSRWSLANLRSRTESSPYKLHVFAHAKLLFDRAGVEGLQQTVRDYFASHSEIEREWAEIDASYQREKREHGEGRTNIFDVYARLDLKYGEVLGTESSP